MHQHLDIERRDPVIKLVPEQSEGHLELRIDIDGREYTRFTHQLAESCLWMPVPLTAMRQTLVDYALKLVEERTVGPSETGSGPDLAEGDNFIYRTVYRAN